MLHRPLMMRPPWCGDCDEQTRQIEVGDDARPARCTRCHPALAVPPDVAGGPNPTPWINLAMEAIGVAAKSGRTFAAYQLVQWYSLPEPPSKALWGSVFRKAALAGVIERVSYGPSPRATRAGGVAGLWRGRQQNHESGDRG